MNFKERFKELLLEYEIFPKKLGELLGIDHESINSYKHGTIPNVKNATKLANYFDCTLNYLLGLSDYPNEYDFKEKCNFDLFFERYNLMLTKNNFTQYYISKSLELGHSCYYLWENGKLPKMETLIKLSKFLNCSIDFLIGKSDIEHG